MKKCDLTDVVSAISDNYNSSEEIFFTDPDRHMPRRTVIIEILKDMRNIMFPGYFSNGAQATPDAQYFVGNTILRDKDRLRIGEGTVITIGATTMILCLPGSEEE